MNDVSALQLVVGLLLLLLAFGAGTFLWVSHQLQQQREKNVVIVAALSTIAGVCYVVEQGQARRLDQRDTDEFWPLELSSLLSFLPDELRHTVEIKFRTLSSGGTGFTQRVAMPGRGRTVELTGQRLTASGKPSIDFIWAADVTEREGAIAARTRIERDLTFLRTMLDRLPIMVWWRGDDLEPAGGNRRYMTTPAIEAASRPLAETARNSGSAERMLYELATDGATQSLDLAEMPLDTGGTIGFAIDRSDTAALRRELDRLAAVHQQVLEAVATAVAIWGPDGRLLFHNQAFSRLWGLDSEWLQTEPSMSEVLDAMRERRVLPEYADFRQFKAEQMGLLNNLTGHREELLHLPDERTLRLTVTGHPFGGLTFSYEDVTDRLALERSFNTLTAVQRETLDNLFEGIAVFGSDGRLKLWNPAFAAIWQFDSSDLVSRPHVATLVDRTKPLYPAENWEVARRESIERTTAYRESSDEIVLRNGAVLEINAVPLPDGNMLLSYRDTTDTARVQRALQEKNDALETATRLKSEFIANVTFELRTPLNAIIGFAEILANQYFGTLNERQLDYSRGILESSQRLLSLVNDILDLATLEAGQLTLQSGPVDIHTLLAGVLASTRERAQRLELTLAFECPTDIGMIIADERRLRQALFNLVSNAIRYTPASGTVTLGARRLGAEVALTVSDTGIGIEPDQLNRVFEKFERGDPAVRNVGAGLGLSLVKSFVELHGGRVEITSTPQQGTTVSCWLPGGRPSISGTRSHNRRRTDPAVPQRPPEHPTVQ